MVVLTPVDRGRIRAALDVTDPEPLPDGHPLFATPGVLVAPHVGGYSEAFTPRIGRFARAQLEAYRDGEPLEGVQIPAAPEKA